MRHFVFHYATTPNQMNNGISFFFFSNNGKNRLRIWFEHAAKSFYTFISFSMQKSNTLNHTTVSKFNVIGWKMCLSLVCNSLLVIRSIMFGIIRICQRKKENWAILKEIVYISVKSPLVMKLLIEFPIVMMKFKLWENELIRLLCFAFFIAQVPSSALPTNWNRTIELNRNNRPWLDSILQD